MKRFVVLFVVCLIAVAIGNAFAAEGNISQFAGIPSTVILNARILPYASVFWENNATSLVFSGIPNQTLMGSATAIVESNCEISSVLTGTPFKNGTYKLATELQRPHGIGWSPINYEFIPFVNSPMGVKIIPINFRATTGPQISSQAAGDYIGSLTLTVYQSY